MTLEEDFNKLAKNNDKEDWNDKVFRETMKNAFKYCASQHIEALKRKYEAQRAHMKMLMNSSYGANSRYGTMAKK